MYIRVWCEYDISGQFGGNNNEEVFRVSDGEDVNKLLSEWSIKMFGENLIDCGVMSWSVVEINNLKDL